MKQIIKESLKPLLESPDKFYTEDGKLKKIGRDTYAFEVIVGFNEKQDKSEVIDVIIADKPGRYHGDDNLTGGDHSGYANYTNVYRSWTGKKKTYSMDWIRVYPGRFFKKSKVITFWVYPDEKELKKIVEIIQKKAKIQMIDNGWRIEVYEQGMNRKGAQEYGNNYNRKEKSELVPIEKYVGSNKPPEKEYIEHQLSPLLKQQKRNDYGGGSKLTGWDAKRNIKMRQAMYAESEAKKYNDPLFETPDVVNSVNHEDTYMWYGDGTYAFGVYNGKVYVSDESTTHYRISDKDGKRLHMERTKWKFPGRIWTEQKLISFWVYPNVEEFKKIIKGLEEALDINIMNDPEYYVEVLVPKSTPDNSKTKKIKKTKRFAPGDDDGTWRSTKGFKVSHVTPKDYVGSEQRSKEELGKEHVISPLLKKQRKVYDGGSKLTGWDAPRNIKWRQAMYAEGLEEDLYPRLFEKQESNSNKLYRCGWCGAPTDELGVNLENEDWDEAVKRIGSGEKAISTPGNCCRREYERNLWYEEEEGYER